MGGDDGDKGLVDAGKGAAEGYEDVAARAGDGSGAAAVFVVPEYWSWTPAAALRVIAAASGR
jgi:hypothetical protein